MWFVVVSFKLGRVNYKITQSQQLNLSPLHISQTRFKYHYNKREKCNDCSTILVSRRSLVVARCLKEKLGVRIMNLPWPRRLEESVHKEYELNL